ncbi:MAG: hypothetical protein JWN84_2512 [Nocardioides sp.]|nr:hypothetical protein [Nocardioides sp.]
MHRRSRSARRTTSAAALAAGATLLSLGLGACGDEAATDEPVAVQTASNGDVFNTADVRFATDMVPHHAEAIEMVTLTQGRSLDPEVQELADAIREAQAPEVETMVDWLTAWDQDIPETDLDHANAGHGEGGGHGGDTDALATASDAEFQDLWLEMMIEHHTGAIEMAEAEKSDGEHAGAIDLAGSIIEAQQAEIDRMTDLLEA